MGSLSDGSGGAADYDALEKAVMAFPDKAESTARMFRLMLPRGSAGSVCVFAEGDCLPAALAVSNLADSVGSIPITVVDDGRIPGWASKGTCAVVMTDLPGGPDPELVKGLEDRGCDVSILKRGGEKGGWNTVVMPGMLSIETLAFSLGYLFTLLSNKGVLDASLLSDAAAEARACRDSVPDAAAKAADRLKGGIVAVYSATAVSAIAVRAADVMQRYTRDLAFHGELPEYDHNELVGWSDPNDHAPELRMLVMEGGPSEGLVPVIIGCMEEVLRENGRDVVAVPTVKGSSLAGDMVGFMAAELIAARTVLRWPTYRSTSSCTAS